MTRVPFVMSLAEVSPEDRDLYLPDVAKGEGYFLHPGLVAHAAECDAKLAETEAQIARMDAQLADLIMKRKVDDLLTAAGADRHLLGGASALFRLRHALVVVDPDTETVTGPDGADLEGLIAAWAADDAQRGYFPARKQQKAREAGFAAALRDLGRGIAH